MCIGILAGLGRIAGTPYLGDEPQGVFKTISIVIRYLSAGFVESIRGTPIIVQAMFLYFAFPMLIRMLPNIDHFRMEAMTAAVITIMFNAGAYIAEIVRGATVSVHKGLIEAGLSLGISRYQLISRVIGPIAIRRMIPPLGNQFIISLKDTSLFIVIGVGELTARAGNHGQQLQSVGDLVNRRCSLPDHDNSPGNSFTPPGEKDENILMPTGSNRNSTNAQ